MRVKGTASAREKSASLRAEQRSRVLLVPDSIHWITGTIAKSIVAHNAWLDGTIISGPVLDIVARDKPDFFDSFDLVHFVCPYASRTWLPELRDRIPTVTSHHHVNDAWELQSHNLGGDAIVVGSPQWSDDVIDRGALPEQVICIPYGVDASRFVPPTPESRASIRASLGIAPGAIVLGFFAKLSSNEGDRKGTDIFASAIQMLGAELPSLAVLIVGPGWDALVDTLRAAKVKCVWLPFVEDAERMPLMYQALDFYWVTARVEGGPVTLLEAMSTGVCCVSTSVGLARELVVHGVNALSAPFDNARAFVDLTLEYAARPDLRASIGAHARQSILDTMDVPVTSQGFREAYRVASARFSMRTRPTILSIGARAPLPQPVLDEIAILEELTWAESLMLQHQRRLALRLMSDVWRKHPLSSLPPRFLLRNLLPRSVVRALVGLKSAASRRS